MLCAPTLASLDISSTRVKSLDLLSHSLHLLPEWQLEKLVVSGLPLSSSSLVGFFRPLAERPPHERNKLRVLKLAGMGVITRSSTLTDKVLQDILPWLEPLEGLDSISLAHNQELGRYAAAMGRFVEVFGRRCRTLDLSLPLQDHHLEYLLPPDPTDFPPEPDAPLVPAIPRLQYLVLDTSRITNKSAAYIRLCQDLRLLHTADTRISTTFLLDVLEACPLIASLNLRSCRGVPLKFRRGFFDSLARGEVVPS